MTHKAFDDSFRQENLGVYLFLFRGFPLPTTMSAELHIFGYFGAVFLSLGFLLLLFWSLFVFFWILCLAYVTVRQLSVSINQYLSYLTCKEERFSWYVPVYQSVTTDVHHDGVSRPEHLAKHSYLLVNQEANGKKNWLWPHSILPGRVLVEHFFPEETPHGPCL